VVNGLWNYASLASRRVLPKARVPYVVFPHGMLDPYFRASEPNCGVSAGYESATFHLR